MRHQDLSHWTLTTALLCLSNLSLPFQAHAAANHQPYRQAYPQFETTDRLAHPLQMAQRPGQDDRFPQDPPEPTPLPADPVLPPSPMPEQSVPSDTVTQVQVREIQVIGSTIFNEADFDAILAPFENRELTLEDLQQAADTVTRLYLDRGYITSRAILGNQTINDGVVQLQVIEGRLEAIRIEGTERLAAYARSRVALGGGFPLNQVDLENQLRLLRTDPLFESVEASLRAGSGLGQSILVVQVREANALAGTLSVDTNSPPSVGTERTGATLQYLNPLGFGGTLQSSAFRATTGGSQLYDVGYRVPVNPMNGTVQFRFLPSSFRLTDASLAALNITGSADVYEVSYRHPLVRTPQEEFALSLGFRHRVGETLLSGRTIDASRTSVIQFGQDYVRRDIAGAWALRSQLNLGTGLLNATIRPAPSADGLFLSWLGQVQRVQVLSPDNLLLFQGDVQLANDSLLGSEQFIVGGGQSVRGYRQNARFGDNGVRASIEDRIVLFRDETGRSLLQVAPFLEGGVVWNNGDNINTQNFLLGTGVGFLFNPIEQIDLRLDVATPLVRLTESGDPDQRVFFYLQFNYNF